MAIQLTQLTIFFSGTSESESESAALKTVVDDLCQILEKTKNVTLKTISWPDDFRPGVNENPQSEINRQVQGNYDIYIGVLGSKFGTPTSQAGSGTEEEFQLAISQFQQDTTSLRIFFYFKRTNQDLFSIDIKQLEKVKKFRTELPQKGVLYMDFKDTANFVEMVKKHLLSLITDDWQNNAWKSVDLPYATHNPKIELEKTYVTTEQNVQKDDKSIAELSLENEHNAQKSEDEIGYFDLIEEFCASIESLTFIMEELAECTANIGEKLNVHTESAKKLMEKHGNRKTIGGSRDAQTYLSKAKDVVNSAGKDLESYTVKISPKIAALKTDFGVMLTRFRDSYNFSNEQLETPKEEKLKSVDALRSFIDTMVGVVAQITSFQEAVSNLPALTTKFSKARKHTASALGELIAEIKIAADQGNDILKEIDESDS